MKKVPLPDGKEGSLSCCGSSLVNLKAMIRHEVRVSHEDGGCLAIGIDRVNQPFAHGIKWLLQLRFGQGPLVDTNTTIHTTLLLRS